jgi:hypothetical protein
MSLLRFTFVPALALMSTLAGTAAQARGADMHWWVTIDAPVLRLPVPVLSFHVPAPVLIVRAPRPQPVVVYPHAGYWYYREPTRWDVDGDGIPNRHDRLYNPAWDRDGDGTPNHRAHRRADHREVRHHPDGDRDRDGVRNRYDRREDRFDDRPNPYRGEWRGPR